MWLSICKVLLLAIAATAPAHSQSTSNITQKIGYNCYPDCIPSSLAANVSSNLTFGKYYAVLNLDLETGAVATVANTTPGQSFIANTASWIDAVNKQNPPPVSIFSAVAYVNNHRPELGLQSGVKIPFASVDVAQIFGTLNGTLTGIYKNFTVNATSGDVTLAKARFYAGAGNQMEEILRAQRIDTVIISGISTGGVVLATAIRLFDLDYNVYVTIFFKFLLSRTALED